MGLDNGIMLKTKRPIRDWEIPSYVDIFLYENKEENEIKNENRIYEYEVCYWRKWWGFRNTVLDEAPNIYDGENSFLKAEDIDAMIDVLHQLLDNPEEWECPIWGLSEVLGHIAQSIVNLNWLKDFIAENQSWIYDCYFYDSY